MRRTKILVLSLLRIGDIVLSAPVLRGLRERHPDAEIHLLINAQFMQVAGLMPYLDRVIPFHREEMQKGLGEAAVPMFDSYERLNAVVDELNAQKYDVAINLTHTRLSGWLLSLIDAKERVGLCFDATGRAAFGSSWFRYLNNQVDAESKDVFHFTDVFRFGVGLNDEIHKSALLETQAGQSEAEEFLANFEGTGPVLAVQVLTSDVKKNWGVERFKSALKSFAQTHPEARIALFGAPFERSVIEPLAEELKSCGLRAKAAILSFEGAFSLLKRSKLLLTGDTSVKHLACAARTPVVELSLGSSDYSRTGAYLHGSVIIQSRETCAPCVHAKPCHRASHLCAQGISVEVVSMVTSEIFSGRSFQLKAIAEEFRDEVEILRVQTKTSGFWAAYSVLEPFTEENVGRWIDLAGRKIWLQSVQGKEHLDAGTEIRKLSELLREIYPNVSGIEWKHFLSDLEKQAATVEGRINSFKTGIRVLYGSYEDPRRIREFVRGMISFRERIRMMASLRSFKASLDSVIEDDISPPFTRFRRIVDSVTEIDRRIAVNLRLIRGLSGEFERGKEMETR